MSDPTPKKIIPPIQIKAMADAYVDVPTPMPPLAPGIWRSINVTKLKKNPRPPQIKNNTFIAASITPACRRPRHDFPIRVADKVLHARMPSRPRRPVERLFDERAE